MIPNQEATGSNPVRDTTVNNFLIYDIIVLIAGVFLIVIRYFFLTFFISAHLFCGDYNRTLIDAKPDVYKALLKTIEHSKKNSEEILLQKVLLDKLSNMNSKNAIEKEKINTPKTPVKYGVLYDKFIQCSIKKDILTRKLKQIFIKIKTLKDEIKKTKNSSQALFTLQLQDAFYSKTKKLYSRQRSSIDKEMTELSKILNGAVKDLAFNKEIYISNIKQLLENSNKIKNEISKLEVQKERLEFLDNSIAEIKKIDSLIANSNLDYQKALRKENAALFLKFSAELKEKDKKAFVTEKQILKLIVKLQYSNSIKVAVDSLLNSMEKNYLGTINVITSSTVDEVQNVLIGFWHLMTKPLFEINKSPISVIKIFISVLIFVLGFYLGGFYRTNIKKVTQNISSINSTTRTIFSNLGYYLIIVIAFILALNVLGINLSSIGLVAGALSVGIGFGLQNIVSNFISGIILMFERSIKIGDYIELSEELKGHVTGINMRSTTINTNSNIDVIVPNQNFIQNNVINWTMNDEIRRFQIPFGVAYGTKPEMVVDVIKDAVKKSGFKDVVDTPSRHTRVIMTGMGNSSVDFELFVWIKGPETLYPKRTSSRFLVLVYNALYANNIEIPFPQQDLHIKSVDDSVKFQVS